MARTARTAILPIWRSDIQPLILHRLALGRERTAAEIAAASGLDPVVVARHVRQLAAAGLIRVERVGRSNLLELDREHPATAHVVALADLSVGLLVDLAQVYDLSGIRRVVVFGSWARRHHGEPGPPPRDVDVFIETEAGIDPWPIQEECLRIGGRHQVAMDVTVLPVTDSASFADAYLNGPTIEIPPEGMHTNG